MKTTKAARRARFWQMAIFAGTAAFGSHALADEIYWQGGTGDWFDANNWVDYSQTNPDGSYVNRVPTAADNTQILNGGRAQIGGNAAVYDLVVDDGSSVAVSAGSLTINSTGYTQAIAAFVGFSGSGSVIQTGGTDSVGGQSLMMGWNPGSFGSYSLSGNSSLAIGNSLNIGYAGQGQFIQDGGTNTVSGAAALWLGQVTGGIGSYSLSSGSLEVDNYEVVGGSGQGTFTQTGGTNAVEDSLNLGFTAGGSGAGSGTYILSGTASLEVGGNEYIGDVGKGTFTQSGGTNSITSGGSLVIGNNVGSTGTYSLSNTSGTGSLSVSGTEYIGYIGTGAFTQSGATNTSTYLNLGAQTQGSSGTFTLQSGSLTVRSYEYVGGIGIGGFNQSGGSNSAGEIDLGRTATASGTYNLAGTGSLSVSGTEYIGYTGTGAFNQGGGTNTSSYLNLGAQTQSSSGTFTLPSGTLTVSGYEYVGGIGVGGFNQSGGSNTAREIDLGRSETAAGTYTLSGIGSLSVSGNEYVGYLGTGTFIQAGGTHTVTGTLTLAANAGSSGTYNVSGGTLTAGAIVVNTGGTLANGGVMSLTAGTNTSSGTYNVQISGSNTSASFGQVIVGAPSVAGKLSVMLGSTYSGSSLPATSDNYSLFTSQALIGKFQQSEAAANFLATDELAGVYNIGYANSTVSLNDFASIPTLWQASSNAYNASPGTAGSFSDLTNVQQGETDSKNPGFLAFAYNSSDGKQIIVAFRGTQLNAWTTAVQNIFADASFITGLTPAMEDDVKDAVSFVQNVQAANPGASIILTGHSLGGALAQLVGEAAGLDAVGFNAPGAGGIYGVLQLKGDLGNWGLQSANNTTNVDFRLFDDQVSLAGTPTTGPANVFTLPLPTGIVVTPNSDPYKELVQNLGAYIALHGPNALLISEYNQNAPLVTNFSGQLNDVQSTLNFANFAKEVATGQASLLIDVTAASLASNYFESLFTASPASDYVLTGSTGSPAIGSIVLPAEAGVTSYNVRSQANGTWTAFSSTAPGTVVTLGSGASSVEFVPMNSSGQSVVTSGFVFDAAFSSTGTFSGTFSETGVSESVSSALWNLYGGGTWSISSNWSGLEVPNLPQDTVTFGPSNTAPATVTLDSSWTVGTINFASGISYMLAPGTGGSLILDNGSSPAAINVSAGAHYISSPITLNSSVGISVTGSGNALTISGSISGPGGVAVSGSGTVTLSAANAYSGGTTVNSGTLAFAAPYALPSFSALTIDAGALATVANYSGVFRNSLFVSSLSIAGSTNAWTGKLDLGDNDLVVRGGSLAQITNQVAEGYNSGAWNGSGGIVSSAAAANSGHLAALGVILNTANGSTPLYTSFDGIAVIATDVLVKYTYYGDANLDGKDDASDYSLIDNGYLNHLTGWYNGDFNYDGIINGSDYTLIDNAFNMQGAQLASQTAASTAQIAAVPEPGAAIGLAIAAFGALARRSRRGV